MLRLGRTPTRRRTLLQRPHDLIVHITNCSLRHLIRL